MSIYKATTWVDGDIPTPKRMNHLETGVSELYGIVCEWDDNLINHTWREINDAMLNGRGVFIQDNNRCYPVVLTSVEEGLYSVAYIDAFGGYTTINCYSPDSCPGQI